jgi:hypothetical protein
LLARILSYHYGVSEEVADALPKWRYLDSDEGWQSKELKIDEIENVPLQTRNESCPSTLDSSNFDTQQCFAGSLTPEGLRNSKIREIQRGGDQQESATCEAVITGLVGLREWLVEPSKRQDAPNHGVVD